MAFPRTVLVTGGAGFIGSELVRQLVAAGVYVKVVDNLVNGKSENLAEIAGQIEFYQTDVRNQDDMETLALGVDTIFHLACLGVRHSIHSPYENHEVNATATLNLLAIARKVGVSRFVYVSSSEVYGTARTVPMTEDHPTTPMTVYGASKLAGECYTRAYYTTYGYPTVVVRPFNSYGPRSHHEGDSGEVIPKFLLRSMANRPMVIFGDGSQTRDFTFVSDTVHGIILSGSAENTVGETINIGNGQEISINELAHKIRQIINKPDAQINYETSRPGDVLRLYADTTKAGQLIGYEPHIPLADGLTLLKDWYESQGQTPEMLLEQEKVRNWEAT